MIVSAVFCPPAPWLLPGLADQAAVRAAETAAACRRAVADLTSPGGGGDGGYDVNQVLILAASDLVAAADRPETEGRADVPADGRLGSDGPTLLGPGAVVAARRFGRSDLPVGDPVMLPGAGSAPGDLSVIEADLGVVVGARLLADSGVSLPTHALAVRGSGPAADPDTDTDTAADPDPDTDPTAGLGTLLDLAGDARIGLLIMADGASCHGEHAPGAPDTRAADFDRDLADAIASGDARVLQKTCGELAPTAPALLAHSLPGLAAASHVISEYAPDTSATVRHTHYSAPLGIGYVVGSWRWDVR